MPTRIIETLRLQADDCQLAPVRQFVGQVGKDLGLDKKTIYDLQLALDEACANTIEHGYGGQGGQIEVTIEATETSIRITLRDWGAAFDPGAVPAPDVTSPLEQRPLGGLGLFIMHQLMDDVQFEFDAETGNTLTMLKRLSEEDKQP